MGEKRRGAEHADKKKNRNGNGMDAQIRDDRNTRSDNGKGTTDKKTRVDIEAKKRLILGSWGVCMWIRHGKAQKDRNRRISKQARPKHSGNSRFVGEKGGGVGCKVGGYAWIGKKRKGQNSKDREAGGGGCKGPNQRIPVWHNRGDQRH